MHRGVVIDRGADALDDVVDVGVIAAGRSVAKNLNRLALGDQAGELMYRKVRPLPCSVDREKSQADSADVEEVRISMAQQFACGLRGSIWRDRLIYPVVFGKRHLGINAVNRT